jgi:hypothetical protein
MAVQPELKARMGMKDIVEAGLVHAVRREEDLHARRAGAVEQALEMSLEVELFDHRADHARELAVLTVTLPSSLSILESGPSATSAVTSWPMAIIP